MIFGTRFQLYKSIWMSLRKHESSLTSNLKSCKLEISIYCGCLGEKYVEGRRLFHKPWIIYIFFGIRFPIKKTKITQYPNVYRQFSEFISLALQAWLDHNLLKSSVGPFREVEGFVSVWAHLFHCYWSLSWLYIASIVHALQVLIWGIIYYLIFVII